MERETAGYQGQYDDTFDRLTPASSPLFLSTEQIKDALTALESKVNQGEILTDEEYTTWERVWESLPEAQLLPAGLERERAIALKHRAGFIEASNYWLRYDHHLNQLRAEFSRLDDLLRQAHAPLTPEDRSKLEGERGRIATEISILEQES